MEPENIDWKICCSRSSAQFIKFAITTFICFSVLLFSMIMIINNPNNDNTIYFSLISSILSLYMTPPKLHEEQLPTLQR